TTAGWSVFRERLPERERGVLIAARIAAVRIDGPVDDPAPGRTVFIELSSEPRVIVAGMYVPSRNATVRQIQRTQAFLAFWSRSLTAMVSHPHRVLAGDLNVVPPDQHPIIFPQLDFEDRWFASLEHAADLVDPVRLRGLRHEFTWRARPSDEGYTYDYVLASRALIPRVANTSYDHTVRMTRGLSDHSAVALSLRLDNVPLGAPRPQQHVRQSSLFSDVRLRASLAGPPLWVAALVMTFSRDAAAHDSFRMAADGGSNPGSPAGRGRGAQGHIVH